MNLHQAQQKITSAPSFAELRQAYMRFMKRLYGKFGQERVTEGIANHDAEPQRYLVVHSHVMNAKSAACKTLQRLTNQVFKETGLPRSPQGKFRGMDGLNIDALDLCN